jgi:hypothetical protein
MMAIDSFRLCSIETTELVALGGHDVLEGAHEPRVENDSGKGVTQQVRGEFVLTLLEPSGTVRRRKWRRKIEVETSVDSRFSGHRCSPLRILHEDHGTHGRDSSAKGAIKDPFGRSGLSAPIVGVYDEKTSSRHITAPACRLASGSRTVRRLRTCSHGEAAGQDRVGVCLAVATRQF